MSYIVHFLLRLVWCSCVLCVASPLWALDGAAAGQRWVQWVWAGACAPLWARGLLWWTWAPCWCWLVSSCHRWPCHRLHVTSGSCIKEYFGSFNPVTSVTESMMWSEKRNALKKKSLKKRRFHQGPHINWQIQCVCNENGEEGMNMFSFNEEFWHLDSSCLTFLTQTALIVCGATLERIQKTQFLKNRAEILLCMQIVSVCVQNVHRTVVRLTHFIIYCSLRSSRSTGQSSTSRYQPEPVWLRWISAGLCGFNPRAESGVLARPGGDRPEDERESHQNPGRVIRTQGESPEHREILQNTGRTQAYWQLLQHNELPEHQ